jgi:mono/diheme cytochrome c family protein
MLAEFPRFALVGCALLTAAGASGAAQTSGSRSSAAKTVWDGVYTAAQAARGKATYEGRCLACHRDGPRKDAAFMRDWNGSDVESLFDRIKMSMPAGAPASLSDNEYVDLVAFLLEANAFPAGTDELGLARIAGIRIEGRNGPEPVPNFALVQSVGCLAQASDRGWVLMRATEPERTKDPQASTEDDRRHAVEVALGSATFGLMNVYPAPDLYTGHRVEAKGLLIREGGATRINVTSIQSLDARCDNSK